MSAATEKGPWFTVLAHAQPAECRSCHSEVYWIITDAGRRMPVDCSVEGGRTPWQGVPGDGARDGKGVSHFATCPQASTWRQR